MLLHRDRWNHRSFIVWCQTKMEQFIQNIPVKALGSMHFIAETCGLLASPNASFVTGATWDINGGLFMR